MRLSRTRVAARHCGFTLIELLVVVAIIAVLISILLPALNHARQQGKAAVCLSNLRSMGVALVLYTDDNNGWFPEWGFAHGGGEARAEVAWINAMQREYGHDRDILRCPSDRSPLWDEPIDPEAPEDAEPRRRTSYASNFYLTATGIDNPLWVRYHRSFNRRDWIAQPASTIFFCELVETGPYATADHVHVDEWDFWYPEHREFAATQVALDRHLRAANYGLVDGHAERFEFEQTYKIEDPYGDEGLPTYFQNKYDPTVAR